MTTTSPAPRSGEAATPEPFTEPPPGASSPFVIERNGINVIDESERKGRPRDLFWPWCAANISFLGMSYAAFVLYFGLSYLAEGEPSDHSPWLRRREASLDP